MLKHITHFFFYLFDVLLLLLSFFCMTLIKGVSFPQYVDTHRLFLSILIVIWLLMSIIIRKVPSKKVNDYSIYVMKVLISDIIVLGITIILIYASGQVTLSRLVVFGTMVLGIILELAIGKLLYKYSSVKEEYKKKKKHISEYDLVNNDELQDFDAEKIKIKRDVIESMQKEIGVETTAGILNMMKSKLTDRTVVLSIVNPFNLSTLHEKSYQCIINLHNLNNITDLNLFIDKVNEKLDEGGYFLCCLETKNQRKDRILNKYPVVLNYVIYFFDFIYKRVFPKMKITRPIYTFFSDGRNMVISRAEALGRISRGGFSIEDERFIGEYLFVEGCKIKEPIPLCSNHEGPLIKLPRVGKGGKIINVYKLRTMHPYSEYIQDYVYRRYNIQSGGKFKNDFRITTWGAFCRKIWLDEFPMFINFFKGELKLFGVRPLSVQYFSLYKKEVQERRIKYKPGLIPPYYADMPVTLDEIQESEMRYFDRYDKHPFFTDVAYIWKSFVNICIKRVRSK